MERQEDGIVSQNKKIKKAGHFKQEEMSAVLDNSRKSRGMRTRIRSLALAGSVERFVTFTKSILAR